MPYSKTHRQDHLARLIDECFKHEFMTIMVANLQCTVIVIVAVGPSPYSLNGMQL